MRPSTTFHVQPSIPERLEALESIAINLRWTWDHETIALFRRLDPGLWESCYHNPALLLGSLPQSRLESVARDEAFLAHLDRVEASLRAYMEAPSTWYRKSFGESARPLVAYFSMEFGITESLPIYSGGLGILAGDHLKSASDLGIPLVGVGLLYQKGYFRQYLSPEGWQQERYPVNDFYTMPLQLVRNGHGEPLRVQLELAGRPALVQIWRAQVGRVPLLLLDTNIPENPEEIQDVADELYGGNEEMRVRQEILLGVGGVRALGALGLEPELYHMNEGHSAFLALERTRQLHRDHGLRWNEALELVRASTLFTTHTPVPAGIDVFPSPLIERYLSGLCRELGIDLDVLHELGRVHPTSTEPFNMAVLALRTSCFVNGVSRLHGKVARKMWQSVWPEIPENELPLTHITNGIHPGSWISEDMRYLYDRYLGPGWSEEPGDTRVWQRCEQIPSEELWRTHERRRQRLVAFTRRRLARQLERAGAWKSEIAEAENVLDPEALTIGFARRFATYKRATLILRDTDRLSKILNHPDRPVQIIFAGKAHPHDENGKALIREIIQLARRPEFRRRLVFVEDYDAVIARYLLQGVDVWLNTPRRPMEASGTSGMKAAFNGALNLSIPDGWWDEAYSLRTGWSIGRGEEYRDLNYQDQVEAGTLYDLLEREVVPLFYKRRDDDLPMEWISLMKSAMAELCPAFNTNRMLQQYVVDAYHPARGRALDLVGDGFGKVRELSAWRDKVQASWAQVRIGAVETDLPEQIRIGDEFDVRAWVQPGGLSPDDLAVQVYMGPVDDRQQIHGKEIVAMQHRGEKDERGLLFRARVDCRTSGLQGLTVRVLPHHARLAHPHCTARICWAP